MAVCSFRYTCDAAWNCLLVVYLCGHKLESRLSCHLIYSLKHQDDTIHYAKNIQICILQQHHHDGQFRRSEQDVTGD